MCVLQETITDQGEYVGWKGRSAQPNKHGGKRAALFVCVTEIFLNMAFISNASNLVTYFFVYMHYPIAHAANMLTNYMGTTFILTLFGGFISDAFITRFWSIIFFGVTQLLGLIILTIQAREPSLRPWKEQTPSSSQEAMLYVGLYAMAFGVGGAIANLPAHGADQFDKSKEHLISRYFNWFFFCLCTGGMLAVTLLVWVQENKGWVWGLGCSTVSLSIAIVVFSSGCKYYRLKVPSGSPLTRIIKVIVSSVCNRNVRLQTENAKEPSRSYHRKFRFLEKATFGGHIGDTQVEETKSFLSLLPIFACTILMNCCLAQLQTFSVQQGKNMNTKVSNHFQIPPASLTSIPLLVMLLSVPFYDFLASLTTKKLTKVNFVLEPLKRIGIGLILASASMTVAALVEIKRRNASIEGTKISVFWLSWQYLLLGVSDMFTLAGMLEFFYSEAPATMRSICTSLSWCSTSMGYFLSSVLVSIVDSASGRFGSKKWLGGRNLDESRLELFYALLAVLNFVNFLNYIYWAKWYKG